MSVERGLGPLRVRGDVGGSRLPLQSRRAPAVRVEVSLASERASKRHLDTIPEQKTFTITEIKSPTLHGASRCRPSSSLFCSCGAGEELNRAGGASIIGTAPLPRKLLFALSFLDFPPLQLFAQVPQRRTIRYFCSNCALYTLHYLKICLYHP